jgi:hypothetical protein
MANRRRLIGVGAAIAVAVAIGALAKSRAVPVDDPGSRPGQRIFVSRGGHWAPFIMYDAEQRVFRMWHHAPSQTQRIDVVHRTSVDGRVWSDPIHVYSGDAWGTGVVRDGKTFRWLHYQILKNQGLYHAESPDGLAWSGFTGPMLGLAEGVGDIIDLYYDPIRQRWGAFVKMFAKPKEFGGPDPRHASVRRLTGLTQSDDFKTWPAPRRVFVPDEEDEGVLEFYGAACCVVRDGHLIAFLRTLRDDVGEGIGYTVLAWSKDGESWERAREPFLDRCPGRFDAAMAWVYGVTEHAGTVYLTYSAYEAGHKVGDRAVGLALMPSESLTGPGSRGPGCGA